MYEIFRIYCTIKNQTNKLCYGPQLSFAVLICKKLYFDYQKFTEVYKWGDANLLMDAIMLCDNAIKLTPDIDVVKQLLPKIRSIIPHMDDFGGSFFGSYALNASLAVYETLEFIADRYTRHIYDIASYYTDTIDFKIREENDFTQLEIENHPATIIARNFILEQTNFST